MDCVLIYGSYCYVMEVFTGVPILIIAFRA